MTAFLRSHATALLLLGLAFFGGSAGLTAAHVLKIRTMRDIGLPIAAEVKPLLERKGFLQEQAEVAELDASARGASYREIYDLYVLPEKPDATRTIAILETLLTQLTTQGVLKDISSIELMSGSGSSTDVAIDVVVTPGKGDQLLDLLDLSGVLTVNDAFSDTERRQLIGLTERENPAVIAAVEQFLGSDLLQYAKTPQLAETKLLQSVGTDLFEQDFRALTDGSRLRSFAQTALLLDGGDASLWPLPLFTIERAHWEQTDDGEHLTLVLRAHAKGEQR